jgi:hypothetical protein
MAKHTPITPFSAHKEHRVTPASLAFPSFLFTAVDFVIAERDLDDVSHSQDPAYSVWLRDAELAQERLTGNLRDFLALPRLIPEDQPLFRTAQLIDAMLGCEELGGARRLHSAMQFAFFTRFQVAGICPTAMHRNAMLIQARHVITALVALPLFDSAPDVLDDDPDPDFVPMAPA